MILIVNEIMTHLSPSIYSSTCFDYPNPTSERNLK